MQKFSSKHIQDNCNVLYICAVIIKDMIIYTYDKTDFDL